MSYNFIVVLTVYKRNHLENQLKSVYSQTITPKHVIVFQNEDHINIDSLKKTYDFLHVKNDYNTKYKTQVIDCNFKGENPYYGTEHVEELNELADNVKEYYQGVEENNK